MIRSEAQQLMGPMCLIQTHFVSAPTKLCNLKVFGPALGIRFVLIVAGHTYYNCRVNPDPRMPRLIEEGKTTFNVSNKVKAILIGALSRETN